jgi:hypothetical protein
LIIHSSIVEGGPVIDPVLGVSAIVCHYLFLNELSYSNEGSRDCVSRLPVSLRM